MSSLIPRASLKRSPRTRTRKNSTSETADIVNLLRDTSLSRRKTRPPPLQIIPEMTENGFDISPLNSPATARPLHSITQQSAPHTSCITLSAYTFSIDDAILLFGGETPDSPALSASSSISDGTSSEGVPPTPRASDDEDGYEFILPTRLRPQRVSIRPLCITKARPMVCDEDNDIPSHQEKEGCVIPLSPTEEDCDPLTPIKTASSIAEETEVDFYSREFEGFISFSPVTPFFAPPARRDSIILTEEISPSFAEFKHKNRSRLSKPLPLLPPTTPPISSFPFIPTFPLVETTAQKSLVRRRRNILSLSDHPSSLAPVEGRPLPRMSIPLDIEDSVSAEEDFEAPSHQVIIEQEYDVENANVHSQPSECARPTSACPLPPAMPETPLFAMCGKVTLPRSSTDSDAPRSSVDSASSFASSVSSNVSISPLPNISNLPSCEDDESEATDRLRSRWSSSTLASLASEQQRSTALLSPLSLKNVFGSRPRWVPPQKTPPQTSPHRFPSKSPKSKRGTTTTTPSSTSPEHIRQGSRSSTSSAGTSSSDGERHDGSPSRTKRKPYPVAMFLRAA